MGGQACRALEVRRTNAEHVRVLRRAAQRKELTFRLAKAAARFPAAVIT